MMHRFYGGLKLPMVFTALGLIFVAIMVGSFVDLKLAQAIYVGENGWSTLIEYVGTLPTSAIASSAGAFFFWWFKNESKSKHKDVYAWGWLIFAWLFCGSFWGWDTFRRHLDGFYWWFIIGLPVFALIDAGFVLLLRKGDSSDYLRKGIICSVGIFSVMVLTFLVKFLVVRPRFMFLRYWEATVPGFTVESYYRDWFSFSHDKSAFVNLPGYESYALQSWPSGHSSFAATLMLIVLYPSCFPRTNGKEIWFWLGGLVLALGIMVARMLDGHHFLTDVGFGALFGVIPVALLTLFLYRKDDMKKPDAPMEQPAE